jgi:excisionase family DNA binding protein
MQEDNVINNIEDIVDGKMYLTHEVASLFRASERTLRRYCSEDMLSAVKIGGKKWLIPGKSIKEFLNYK